jgi:hypothetical protein
MGRYPQKTGAPPKAIAQTGSGSTTPGPTSPGPPDLAPGLASPAAAATAAAMAAGPQRDPVLSAHPEADLAALQQKRRDVGDQLREVERQVRACSNHMQLSCISYLRITQCLCLQSWAVVGSHAPGMPLWRTRLGGQQLEGGGVGCGGCHLQRRTPQRATGRPRAAGSAGALLCRTCPISFWLGRHPPACPPALRRPLLPVSSAAPAPARQSDVI